MALIEADIEVEGMRLQLLRESFPAPSHHHTCDTDHTVTLFLPPVGFSGQIRFTDRNDGEYRPISPLYFRAAGVGIQSVGTVGDARWVRLSFSHDHFVELLDHEFDWTWEKLEAGLTLSGTPVEPLMMRLGREAMAPGLASETLIQALGTAAIIDVARLLDGSEEQPRKGQLSAGQLNVIRERAASLSEPAPSLAELARLCGMIERNLLRLFKQTTGESVAAFVRNIRCDRAREMLAQTELPLKEIAYRLGFASHSSFTAAFRRETGINPTDFRRDHAIRRARAH